MCIRYGNKKKPSDLESILIKRVKNQQERKGPREDELAEIADTE